MRERIKQNRKYAILRHQDWKCAICGIKLKFSKNHEYEGEVAHFDHIIPINSKTKMDFPEKVWAASNIQALCQNCNRDKWDNVDPNYMVVKIYELLLIIIQQNISIQERVEDIENPGNSENKSICPGY